MAEAVQQDHATPDELFEAHAATAQELADKDQGVEFDYETAQGNKDARSYLHRIRGAKGDIERARKAAKADIVARGKAIDQKAREVTGVVQAVIDRHERPLKEIEQREERRVEGLREEVANIRARAGAQGKDLETLRADLAWLQGLNLTPDAMQEFFDEASDARTKGIDLLSSEIAAEEQRAAEREELERLRREKAEAERVEQERIAREAQEKADAERRAADLEARDAKDTEIRDAICRVLDDLDGQQAQDLITAINDGRIPHVSITY